ncbi:MAG: methyltransferase [Thermoplasmatales archaeon]|nr:methyltransferase [Thermoplasmatales archaeon]
MEIDGSLEIVECPNVYPPSEDSYLLIRALSPNPGEMVLEIGCGSGIVSMHMALAGADVVACDIDPDAVACAKGNAERNGIRMRVVQSDLFSDVDGVFDLIVFNLPYLPFSDDGPMAKAWSGGADGLGPLGRLLKELPRRLRPGGQLVVVVSSLSDMKAFEKMAAGFQVETLASEKLFFEELKVISLRPTTS